MGVKVVMKVEEEVKLALGGCYIERERESKLNAKWNRESGMSVTERERKGKNREEKERIRKGERKKSKTKRTTRENEKRVMYGATEREK